MTFLTKTLTTVSVASALLAGGASAAVATSNADEWFYYETVQANVITWGGFRAATGSFLGEGLCVDPVVGVNSLIVDRDPVTEKLYVLGATGVFTVDFATDRCTLVEILVPADLPSASVSLRGLTLNDSATELDVLWYDGEHVEYVVTTVNPSDGAIIRSVSLDSVNLVVTHAGAITRIENTIFVSTANGRLRGFDAVTGEELWDVAGPPGTSLPKALDRSSDGLIQLVTVRTSDGQVVFSTFDPADSSWSTVVPTNYPRDGYTYIDVDSDNLANTGIDPTGLVLAAGSLLGAGAIVARRRARR